MKKIISVLLAFLMLVTMFPLSAFAQEQQEKTTVTEQEINYNASNVLGDVVANAMNESETEKKFKNNCYIQSVEISELSANVILSAQNESTVVVSIYDEESNIMVTSGKANVDSTTESVTVALAECKMPDYFVVKAFLINSANEPICTNYENREYTKAFEEFFEKTIFDFDEEKVINLDYGYESNFAVISDDAKLVEQTDDENILTINDFDNGIYVFENANKEITSLKENDVLYFVYGEGAEDYILTKVGTIENDDGTVTITTAEEFEIRDFFSYIKIDSSKIETDAPSTYAMARGFDENSGNEDAFSDEFSISVSKEYKSDDDIDVSFSGMFKAKFYLQFYYDFKLFGEDYYEITQTATLSFSGQTEISVSGEKEFEPLVLFHGGIPIYAGIEAEVTFSLKFVFSAKLSASGSIEVKMVNGSRKIAGRADEDISKSPSIKLDCDISGTATFDAIPSVSVGFKILKIIKVEMGINADFKISGTIHIFDGSTDESFFSPNEKHSCSKCIDGDIELALTGAIKVSFGLNKEKQKTVLNINLVTATFYLSDFYISITKEYGIVKDVSFGLGSCPNIQYKVTFLAIDDNNNPLEGVKLTVGSETLTTDSKGTAVDYYFSGAYSCKAELDGYEINKELIYTDPVAFAVFDGTAKVTIHMTKAKNDIKPNFTALENMLNSAAFSWDSTTVDDFSKLPPNVILENYITDPSVKCGVYNFFSEEKFQYTGGSSLLEYADPKGIYFFSYELDADLADWILLNVFNVSPDRDNSGDYVYYYGDKLYIEPTDPGGGPRDVFTVMGYTLLEGNKYELTVCCETEYPYYREFNYYLQIVASPQHDSVYGDYWRIYSFKRFKSEPDYEYSILDHGTCGDNLTWTLYDDGELVISGTGEMNVMISPTDVPWKSLEDAIEKVTIDNGVTYVTCTGFLSCSNLKSFAVDKNNAHYSSDTYGVLFNKDKTMIINYPRGNDRTEYTIPDSVAVIDWYAFWDCNSLVNINIPAGVTDISPGAFCGCSNLTSIIIPDGITSIDEDAFSDCESLESITIPSSVTYVGVQAFRECTSLKNVYIESIESWLKIGIYGYSSNPLCYGSNLYCNNELVTKVIIPDDITSIRSYAFYGCTSLNTVVIPNSVTAIGNMSFTNCDKLTSITINASVTSIGEDAFNKCTNLETIYYTGTKSQWNRIAGISSIGLSDDVEIIYNYNPVSTASVMALSRVSAPASVSNSGMAETVTDAVVGNEYMILVVRDANAADLLAAENLLFIDQKTADSETLTFEFNLKDNQTDYTVLFTSLSDTNIPHEHTPGEWEVVTPAQINVDGLEQQKCTVCGEVLDERVIPALGDSATFTPGDLNGDGTVNASDARTALRISAKLETPTDIQKKSADVNSDGRITASDARIILRVSAKLETL